MMAKMQTLTRNNQAVRLLLERTVIESPDDPETYLIVADQAYRANRTIEAEALFLMAEPKVKNFTENAKRKRNFEIRLLAGMAAVAERRAQWDKSYQLLTKMVEADPDNAVSHARLGLTLYRIEKPKEALKEFTKARELNPDMPHPYVSVAQLFSQEGDTEKARKAFERAYSEEKGNEKTAQAFAEWLILQNQLDEAQKVAKTLRENAPGSVSALLLDGIVAHMQGDSERAENALQKVLSLEPRHAQASDLLALLLIQRDNVKSKERALSYAELNAERFPNNAQANITKAWVQYKLGNKAEAQKSLEQGSRSGQMRADSMYLIAEIMVAEGQKQKAIAALQQGTAQRSGLFVFRREAQALLEKLKSEADSSSESGN
ncbi:MAG: tetratricopeptide repeat protein [Pirellulales bacterium]|nr:tetratricopeptide repeat protein [Pirellulales bacterium]